MPDIRSLYGATADPYQLFLNATDCLAKRGNRNPGIEDIKAEAAAILAFQASQLAAELYA